MNDAIDSELKGRFAILFLGLAVAASATAADLRVPADYPTIQAAVDAAKTKDVIRIASGVYTNQVRINGKKLSLIGQPGTILRATEHFVPFISPFPGVPYTGVQMMIIELSEVAVRGLTFEGERLAAHFAGEGAFRGLTFMRSGGVVENCSFYGFRDTAFGPEDAVPLWCRTFENDDVTLRVSGCVFADNYGAIFLRGGSIRQNITATIENNTILGLGPVATALGSAGIDVRPGVGGRIAGNTISGFSEIGTTAEFPIGFGILASDNPAFSNLLPLRIEDNTFRNNQMHIVLNKADGSVIQNNRFQGTAPGIDPLGIAVSGNNVTIADNQFEGMPEGIRLIGNEPLPESLPGLEDLLGFAIDAQIVGNRFCGVTNPINRQSPATATETGTSLDPCVSRPLAIAPAALLSWPADEAGWTVESATNPAGPWTPSKAIPFEQDGRNNLAVPADGERRFFRLR